MKIFCTTISFILGLYFLRNNIVLSIIISLIYLVFIFIRFNKKYAFLMLSIFIGGAILGNLKYEYSSQDNIYQGMVVEVKKNYFLFQSHFEKYYVYEENTTREIGDFLTIKSEPSKISFQTFESQFDFNSYLKDKGVTRSLKINNCEVNFSNPIRVHSRKEKFLSKFSDETRDLVNAVLFNEKDYSNQTIKNLSSLSLIYLLSTSGIYMHIIFAIITYVFALYSSDKVAQLVPILLFSPLLIFSFPKIGLLRVFIVSSLRYINEHFWHKKFTYLTLLSSVALFFVIIDFHLAYQSSFYIGFSLSLLSIFFRRSIFSLPSKPKKFSQILFVSLFLFPLQTANNKVHILHNSLQKILTPIFISYFVMAYICFIGTPIISSIEAFSDFLIGITKVLYKIDISIPIGINSTFYLVYYACFLIGMYLFEARRTRHLINVMVGVATYTVSLMLPIHLFTNAVYFINVGQGDSILIQNRNHFVLIDTGGSKSYDMAQDSLIPFFNKMRINHLDLLITTHDDFDHNGATNSLLENFNVYNYLNKREDFPYQVGDLTFENINNYDGDKNDASLVFKLEFMNKKWLFMGDASVSTEKYLIEQDYDLDIDILKVGHHGSSTSSSERFIQATSPTEAIISCGANNKYGHPNKEVIDRLNKYDVKIRRTDIEGTISYVSMFA